MTRTRTLMTTTKTTGLALLAAGLMATGLAASAALAADAADGIPKSRLPAAGTPNIAGAWTMPARPKMVKTVAGKEPPLLPAARAEYQKRQAALQKDPKTDPIADCLPHGPLRIFYNPYPLLILQESDQVDFVFEANHTYRFVDLTRPPPQLNDDTRTSTYMGYAAGKWQGKTLVVDTVGFNDKTWLDASGLPHGEKLTTQEKFTLKDPNTLEGVVTVTDPDNYSAPWTTSFTLKRLANYQPTEMVCVNDHKM